MAISSWRSTNKLKRFSGSQERTNTIITEQYYHDDYDDDNDDYDDQYFDDYGDYDFDYLDDHDRYDDPHLKQGGKWSSNQALALVAPHCAAEQVAGMLIILVDDL